MDIASYDGDMRIEIEGYVSRSLDLVLDQPQAALDDAVYVDFFIEKSLVFAGELAEIGHDIHYPVCAVLHV
ncbi:MAG: hypothetical protein A4E66_01358 [Syntrophus sp. PtaB.Bin001]|nr:MAG: hypothetical protein A4E66_01358 [Syntrophus sp. PtaB.Bin001]